MDQNDPAGKAYAAVKEAEVLRNEAEAAYKIEDEKFNKYFASIFHIPRLSEEQGKEFKAAAASRDSAWEKHIATRDAWFKALCAWTDILKARVDNDQKNSSIPTEVK